jgi:hypothetical protein
MTKWPLFDQTDLDRIVAIRVDLLALDDQAWTSLDNRDWLDQATLVEDLGHPQFLTQDARHRFNLPLGAKGLDFYVHTGWQLEFHQRVNRLTGRLENIEQTFVGPNLELFPRFLVYVGTAIDRVPRNVRRQGDRPHDPRTGAPGRIDNLAGGSV